VKEIRILLENYMLGKEDIWNCFLAGVPLKSKIKNSVHAQSQTMIRALILY
jgi:hypothetical protein